MTEQRLSKVLSRAGVASRRACEEIIFAGRVTVDGKVCTMPQHKVSWENNRIKVDGEPLIGEQRKVYYLLNKPIGMLCSAEAMPNCKRLVLDLFSEHDLRLFTVGRLDKETSGLLIVTNDGEFANRVIHPRYGVQKEYLARTNREITPEHLETLSNGCVIEGVHVKPHKVAKVRRGTVKIIVMEGKKREVRELLAHAGLKTLSLSRVRIGNLHLGRLPEGKWRTLSEKERQELMESN